MLQITSTNEEKVLITINPLTSNGNPAAVTDLTLVVTEGDATLEVVDALNFYVVSGNGGLSKVLATADADLGDGVVPISDEVEYFVVAAQASSFGLTAAAPVIK